MGMVIRFRDSLERLWRMFYRLDFHALAKESAFHLLLIIAIALLFYGIETFIELFARDIDNVVDIVMAIASTFILLWIRSIAKNARLAQMLRAESEARANELASQIRFLSEVAHEFQTPLAILRGNIDILAERKKASDVATATLDRLSRLVANLLDVAKLDFGAHTHREIVDANLLAETVREDCAILAEDRGVTIALAATQPVFISVDKDKFKEVLLNLLSNALKHTPAGGSITIEIGAHGSSAKIAVADTGSGIPPEHLPYIFERLYRIDNDRSDQPSGTGLGLHICRQIIRALDGTITAESDPGRGSRFIVRLPLASPDFSFRQSPTAVRPGSGIMNL